MRAKKIILCACWIICAVWVCVYSCLSVKEYIERNSHDSFEANGVNFICNENELPTDCEILYVRPFSGKKMAVVHSEYWEKGSFCLLVDDILDKNALEHIAECSLKKLVINCVGVESLDPLSDAEELKHLWINTSFSEEKENLGMDFEGKFSDLEELYIYDNIDSVGNIGKILSLKQLKLSGEGLKALTGFGELENLETLDISHTGVSDISCLSDCLKLHELNVDYTNISDISVLKDMKELEVLKANRDYDHKSGGLISDISVLADKPKLRIVELYGTDVGDISPLAEDAALETVELSYTYVHDPTPLMNLPKLKDTGMYDCPLTEEKAAEFFEWYGSRPEEVYYCKQKFNQ